MTSKLIGDFARFNNFVEFCEFLQDQSVGVITGDSFLRVRFLGQNTDSAFNWVQIEALYFGTFGWCEVRSMNGGVGRLVLVDLS